MRQEIGKWFLDIAKYVTTAVVISSFLGVLSKGGQCTPLQPLQSF